MQELVVESLVVSLAMVVFSVLVDETTQMPLAERDHACETLLFDRPDEPLGIGVEIGTLRRQPNRLNTGALQDLAKDPRIEGIAVVNQMARPAQTAIDRVGQIASLLLHPRAARLRVDPGDGHAAGSQLDHEEDEVPPEPRQRQHLDGEQIAGRQALPVRLQERLPGHVPAPLGRRVDSVVVQDPLHRGPGESVAEVRERAADPRVAPPRIVDRHPDHELGDVLSGHWSTSTSAGAAIVFLGDQSPVPTQDRIRGDDARDLRQDPPAEFVTAHSESTTLGVRQAKRPRAQVFSEDPILLPEIVDQIVLVTVHPASEREDEELQRRRHSLRLLGRLDQHRPSLGRFFAPYALGRRRWTALVHGSRALGEPRSTSWPSWRQQVHDLDMKSRVHPKYKTKYHVGNWPAYDRALVQRGDITVWLAPDAIATWEAVGVGKRGGQRQYSDLAIETALTLRLIFHLPLRQTEGFLTSIFGMLGLELSTPDHTTLSRRGQHLDLTLRRAPAGAGLHLMVDSTGLSIVGEGEWAAAKHGGRGRRGWKKLHLGVDRSGVIVARALTEASVDDATTGITLIEAVDGTLGRVTADTAYDTVGFYEAAGARGATVVVPPTSTANVSRRGPRSRARDRTILAVKERGRRRWKKMSGYHGQARVENAFFRYKSIIGDSLRACSPAGRGTEVDLACNILNQMTGLGRPMSHRIGR